MGTAFDRLLRLVLEVVKDGDGRVAGELCATLADQGVRAQVSGRELVVGAAGVRPQVNAAEGVVRDVPGDVRALGHRLHHGSHLRLGRRIRAGPTLLVLRHPLGREVAVEIETLERRRDLDRDAVVVLDPSLGQETVERTVVGRVDRLAANQQLLFVRVPAPRAVRVLDPHVEHATVTVEIFDA